MRAFQNVVNIGIIPSIKYKKKCADCCASFYIAIVGEDNKHYMVPFKPVFCPSCGRRLEDG